MTAAISNLGGATRPASLRIQNPNKKILTTQRLMKRSRTSHPPARRQRGQHSGAGKTPTLGTATETTPDSAERMDKQGASRNPRFLALGTLTYPQRNCTSCCRFTRLARHCIISGTSSLAKAALATPLVGQSCPTSNAGLKSCSLTLGTFTKPLYACRTGCPAH